MMTSATTRAIEAAAAQASRLRRLRCALFLAIFSR
jgi:hypothetical protein